ncbi:MAG: hypothetical protein COV35_05910 [Alphaproteobacteria bacterium CG11_big_fil_rev_8_21_14_0_20_39_49]|nr:MAG: hypothetical protein COV35_05910 [Alphaproteobacteria bacterium CG11_big_fil_rev_8_21_14_0_20_39_49]
MSNTIEERLLAICEINSRYKHFINNDPILKNDFDLLVECSQTSDTMTLQLYKKVINHLIAESYESIKDNLRIADESPVGLPEGTDYRKQLQQRRGLRKALVDYKANYLVGQKH